MERITIKKIAELAGVSVPAVSYVLNNKKGVSEETRKRVLDIINELNYTPNVNSRRLILQRSFNILVCFDERVSSLDNFFYTEILSAIVSRGAQLGYNIVVAHSGSPSLNEHLLQNLSQHNADGVIFLQDIPESLQYNIEKCGIPYIIVDSQIPQQTSPCISSDVEQASYTATQYLIEHGHKKIAFIGMDRLPAFYRNTFSGYKRALADHRLSIQLDWIQSDAYNDTSAQIAMKRILSSTDLPTAVFCAGDLFAIGAMNALKETGYRVPDDFSFIGIDDIILSKYYNPPLTTVHIDKQKMGKLAVEFIDDILNERDVETKHIFPFQEIIERESVRRLT